MNRTIKNISGYSKIDGVIPGIKGQRAFPNGELQTMDPFVMLDHIGPQNVGVSYFVDGTNGAHPHRGFETITFMFEGEMHHKDSLGNKTVLKSGAVQRMNAGKGIMHGGDFKGDKVTGGFHEVQLWVNLPASKKMMQPNIHNLNKNEIPVIRKGNTEFRIISGAVMGKSGLLITGTPTKIIHVLGESKVLLDINDLPETFNVLIYVLKGMYEVNGELVKELQTVQFNNDGDTIQFKGSGELLIIAGKPLNEPVVMGGPFVMNTEAEIGQAYTDFNHGLFGNI